MQHFKDCKEENTSVEIGGVFLGESTYPVVHLYLGNYFISHGYPYNEMCVKPTRSKQKVEDALKNFRQGAAYFFEGFMHMTELDFLNEEEIAELAKCEHLCTIGKDDLQRILESYKNARMDLVRRLIQSDNE